VSLFGFEVPLLCSFRRMTGYNCPGCGMTRSFAFMAHGHVIEAFRMNAIGPLFFAFLASQVPWRIWRLWRGPPAVPRPRGLAGEPLDRASGA
jgi:hypothetical protein